jgi:hypothetical protein
MHFEAIYRSFATTVSQLKIYDFSAETPEGFEVLNFLRVQRRHDCSPAASFANCVMTLLLTPWSRVLLEKLIGLQLVKKFPALYGTRRFITAFTSALHLSLS